MAFRGRASRLLLQLVLLVFALVWTYPLTAAILSSLKTDREMLGGPLTPLPEDFKWDYVSQGDWGAARDSFHFENYSRAWYVGSFDQYFLNSVVLSASVVAIVVAMSCLSGYVLGRYRFPGKRVVVVAFAIMAFLPEGYTIIPVWYLIKLMHLSDSRLGLIIAVSSGGHLLYILLFAAYFRGLPREIEESAYIDGAGFLRTFVYVMLPMAKPAIASVVILEAVRSWNDFFMPLVFTANNPDLQTIAVGLFTQFVHTNTADLAMMSAGVVIAFIPVVLVFVALQKYFVEGIAGAIK